MRKKILVAVMSFAVLGLSSAANAATPVIKVTLLGTGVPLLNAAALDRNGRALSGLLVEAGGQKILFDCGQGVYNRLLQIHDPLPPGPIDPFSPAVLNPTVGVNKVFISHLHSDHIADLAPLYSIGALYRHPKATDVLGINNDLTQYPFPTTTPLKVWGPGAGDPTAQPVGTQQMMDSFHKAYMSDFRVRNLWSYDPVTGQNTWDASVGLKAVETNKATTELTDGMAYKITANGLTVTAFLVDHHPVTPSFGFRVDFKGRSFVYSGDTAPTDNLVKYATHTEKGGTAKPVDLLVHEVYGYARDASPNIFDYHTSPEAVATIFNKVKPTQAVFTHLVIPPGTAPADLVARTQAGDTTNPGYTGPLWAGNDLDVFTINDDGTVTTPPVTAAVQRANKRKATSHALEVIQAAKD